MSLTAETLVKDKENVPYHIDQVRALILVDRNIPQCIRLVSIHEVPPAALAARKSVLDGFCLAVVRVLRSS